KRMIKQVNKGSRASASKRMALRDTDSERCGSCSNALVDENSMRTKAVIHSDPDILGGTPMFVGTRDPFQALIDYLEAGHTLSDFLTAFPTVARKQALAALDQAGQVKAELIDPARRRPPGPLLVLLVAPS